MPFCADSRLSSCFQSQSLSIYGRRVLGGHWPPNRNTVSYNTGVQYSYCTVLYNTVNALGAAQLWLIAGGRDSREVLYGLS